jgi:CubicO group peptidase (beta-lactamase class C family)
MSAKAWVSLVCQLAVALVLAPSAPAAEPSDLESELTMSIGGVEQTLTLQEAMDGLNIPSVSLALIDRDRIAFTRAYGAGVAPETLYQAASLSKFVAAVGAMRLVEAGQIALDQDVNDTLTSWKVPSNGFDHKVTLRWLLSMTAGIGVPGFVGYELGAPLPT